MIRTITECDVRVEGKGVQRDDICVDFCMSARGYKNRQTGMAWRKH